MRVNAESVMDLISTIKLKLGLNLERTLSVSEWNGDTETGFYDELEIDMGALDEDIDEFIAELSARQSGDNKEQQP